MRNTKLSHKSQFFLLGLLLLYVGFWLSCTSDKALYPVEIQSMYGFINHKGSLSIPPRYSSVQRYVEGLAPVQHPDGSLAYLNLKGEELSVPETYGTIEKIDVFSDGLARVVVRNPESGHDSELVGYINNQMAWEIIPQFKLAGQFSEGLAAVLHSELQRASYIDKTGSEVFVLENVTAAGPMRGGFTYFVRNERFGIVNDQGKIVRKAVYLFLARADPVSGLARALDDESELYGFVDRTGTWVIPPKYPNAKDFSDGFAAVFIRNENWYGYIDVRGDLRIAAAYQTAGSFYQGFAWVQTDKGFRYIDRDGEWLSPLIFTSAYDFYQGRAAARQSSRHLYLNKRGSVVWSNQ